MTNPMPILGSCGCRKGVQRDNCPTCEGTGQAIDWRQYHAEKAASKAVALAEGGKE